MIKKVILSMNSGNLKIVLNTAYMMSNLGDAAITKIMIEKLNKFSKSKISIFCYNPSSDFDFFSKYSNVYGDLYSIENELNPSVPKFLIAIKFIIKTLSYLAWSKLKNFPINFKTKEKIKLLKQSNLIIYAGGGYIGGSNNPFPTIFTLYLSKIFGKKVYLSGVTIEPPKGFFSKHLIYSVLNRIDLITVREPISMKVLNELKIRTKKVLTADYVFLQKCLNENETADLFQRLLISKDSSIKIGLNLMELNTLKAHHTSDKINSYENSIIKAMELILKKTNCIIYLFPFQIDKKVNDLTICENVKNNLGLFSNRIKIINENFSPEQMKTIIGFMDIFIGTRFHSLVFALSQKVPTIAIGYHQKCIGLMQMINLEKWLLDFSFDEKELAEKVLELLDNREKIIMKISEKIPELEMNAQRNFELIHELIQVKN